MKTYKSILIASLILGMMIIPSVFAVETSVSSSPQTLADFQRAYMGTKPAIAHAKYWEARFLAKYPQPTLVASRMRTEAGAAPQRGQGTKPDIRPSQGSPHAWALGNISSSKG